jgi:hypothetical protein
MGCTRPDGEYEGSDVVVAFLPHASSGLTPARGCRRREPAADRGFREACCSRASPAMLTPPPSGSWWRPPPGRLLSLPLRCWNGRHEAPTEGALNGMSSSPSRFQPTSSRPPFHGTAVGLLTETNHGPSPGHLVARRRGAVSARSASAPSPVGGTRVPRKWITARSMVASHRIASLATASAAARLGIDAAGRRTAAAARVPADGRARVGPSSRLQTPRPGLARPSPTLAPSIPREWRSRPSSVQSNDGRGNAASPSEAAPTLRRLRVDRESCLPRSPVACGPISRQCLTPPGKRRRRIGMATSSATSVRPNW